MSDYDEYPLMMYLRLKKFCDHQAMLSRLMLKKGSHKQKNSSEFEVISTIFVSAYVAPFIVRILTSDIAAVTS